MNIKHGKCTGEFSDAYRKWYSREYMRRNREWQRAYNYAYYHGLVRPTRAAFYALKPIR